mgnify:CR=1 FL=1
MVSAQSRSFAFSASASARVTTGPTRTRVRVPLGPGTVSVKALKPALRSASRWASASVPEENAPIWTTNPVADGFAGLAGAGSVAAALEGAAGFTVAGNAASLAAAIDFPAGTGGTGTATHVGIGTSASGAGKLLYKGTLTPNITCGNGITPRVNAGVVVTED